MARKARLYNFRIIGPNCIGVYCPECKVPYGPRGKIGEVGSVGSITQSSYVGEKLVALGDARGICFSKGVSFGDGLDLDSADFMEYMAVDPKTSIIGTYIKNSRQTRRLFSMIKQVAQRKPLIVWKSSKAEVASLGVICGSDLPADSAAVWSAALKQSGAIEVHSLDELTDTLLIFQQLNQWNGDKIAIIGGLADGGGVCVSVTDACAELGLSIPRLGIETQNKLISLLGQLAVIVQNLVDIGEAGGNHMIIREAIEIVLADPSIDLVLVQEDIGILLNYMQSQQVKSINDVFVKFRNKYDKPIILVLPTGSDEVERLETAQELSKGKIPIFDSAKRAAKAIVNLTRYSRNLNNLV